MHQLSVDTPIGPLLLVADEAGAALTAVHLPGFRDGAAVAARSAPVLDEAAEQLTAYFAGERSAFGLPLAPRGTAFQRTVWDALLRIPYGETRSYAQVARELGRPDRVRAVGSANARNPLAVVVPCHRVVGSDGSLTGYAGGLERKRALLDLERGAPPLW
jgi:methylated-DNA-[protein]-cysteine S-methyltransferase